MGQLYSEHSIFPLFGCHVLEWGKEFEADSCRRKQPITSTTLTRKCKIKCKNTYNSIGTYTTTTNNLPSMISLPLVCLSSASNMYLASSSKAADLITRECLVPSLMSSNLSSPVISWVPLSQRKVLGSLDTSHSNLASSFSKTLTSLRGVMKMSGSSEREAGAEPFRACRFHPRPLCFHFRAGKLARKMLEGVRVQSVPFTFRLAADLALAAWKETSPVISSWQL